MCAFRHTGVALLLEPRYIRCKLESSRGDGVLSAPATSQFPRQGHALFILAAPCRHALILEASIKNWKDILPCLEKKIAIQQFMSIELRANDCRTSGSPSLEVRTLVWSDWYNTAWFPSQVQSSTTTSCVRPECTRSWSLSKSVPFLEEITHEESDRNVFQGVFSWWKSLDLATTAHFVVIWHLMSNYELTSIVRFIT